MGITTIAYNPEGNVLTLLVHNEPDWDPENETLEAFGKNNSFDKLKHFRTFSQEIETVDHMIMIVACYLKSDYC